ncbi:LL-diaminopimelate aminotransferase [Gloeocapsa sp. PCC 73106]|uniref:LL-diaminopimelate aminotransferase n=1 Tax=Gloeocapsa sp. PCC 73106 TaxID=102232 RepID=UPI0002ABD2E6|nr:aspartate/tyrosine/aromatic aminotransferase [Gloeocapsa sp. PCC 73106]
MKFAQRLAKLQTNVFADMDRAKAQAEAAGKTIIDLSLGSSDLPTPEPIIQAIAAALTDSTTHGYLLHRATQDFRNAVAKWYETRFKLTVNPETEVIPLIGSQEGTAHLPLAILNPGDFALLQDPGYPSHSGGVYLAGGQVYTMTLLPENQFLPNLGAIPPEVLAQSKMMVLSYPHNPTTAIAPLAFFEEAVAFCRHHNLILVHDFPYLDLVFAESSPVPSILQADPSKSLSIEFFTFSKSYNMGGFRIGYAIGNPQLIQALRRIKAVIDFNQYVGILRGAIVALASSQDIIQDTVNIFQRRRDFSLQALAQIAWEVPIAHATPYLWAQLPEPWSQDSVSFCTSLVQATGVALAPGAGFGKGGEGYVRFALVKEEATLSEAIERIGTFLNLIT